MSLWTMAMAAWVAGLAWQLQQSSLTALAWAQGACAFAALMVLVSVWLRRSKPAQRRAAWPLVWLACALLAWGSTTWRAHALMQQTLPASWQDQDLLLEGQVLGLPTVRGGSLGFDVAVQSLALHGQTLGQGMPRRVMLYWRTGDAMQVQAGQVWRWTVRLQPPVPTGNPGGFDAALWLLDKGVRATGSVRTKKGQTPQLLQSPSHWWSAGAVDRLRQTIRESIQRQEPDARLAGVLAGLTIGDQSAINREDWDVFRKTSIAHLIRTK